MGRLELKPDVRQWLETQLKPPVFLQPLTPSIALRAGELSRFHGHPVDRMITATAIELDQPLVTADARIVRWFEAKPYLRERVIAIA